jgi:hypothetical protein
MNTLEKIVNILLLNSGSMQNFTEMKGYIDQLQTDNVELALAYKKGYTNSNLTRKVDKILKEFDR